MGHIGASSDNPDSPKVIAARQNSLESDGGIHDEKKRRIQMDMIVIATSLLLQDGPFFCLRMTLIFK
jgi:hypothetical protein